MKKIFRKVVLAFAHVAGTSFADLDSGQPIGRALVFSWRGKIHIIGLGSAVRPVFIPQKRVTYWKQEIGFSKPPNPDVPSLPEAGESGGPQRSE